MSELNEKCIHKDVCAYVGPAYGVCALCHLFKDENEYYKLPAPIGSDAYLVRQMRYDVDGYGMQFQYYWGVEKIKFSIRYLDAVNKTVFFDEDAAEKVRKEKEDAEKLY